MKKAGAKMAPKKMKAWRFYALGDMRLDTVPYPTLKPGGVILKTRIVQPSITEVVRSHGKSTGGSEFIKKLLAEKAPVQLFGHEFCAEVVAVGEGVEGLKPGDRVVPGAKIPCGVCANCRTGATDLCRRGPNIGREIPGLFAEYAWIPAVTLLKIPKEISDSEGAAIQSLTSAVGWVHTAQLQTSDVVAIFGLGVMGNNCMQLARVGGAGKVIGVDIRPEALEVAKKVGADAVVDATKEDPVKAILDFTGGLGADVVFECAGGSPSEGLAGPNCIPQAVEAARDCGKILQVGAVGDKPRVDILAFRDKNLAWMSAWPPTRRLLQYAVDVVASKRVQLAPTVKFKLQGIDKVPKAFEITGNKAKNGTVNPAQVVIST